MCAFFLVKRHQHHKFFKDFFFWNGIPTTTILFDIFAIVYSSEEKQRNIVFKKFKQLINGWCLKFNPKSLNNHALIRMYAIE